MDTLPQRYRRLVEQLEDELRDPVVSSAAGDVLRHLVSALLVHPGDKRGEVSVELHGDLAAFLELDAAVDRMVENAKKPLQNSDLVEVLATLDAGTGFEPVTFRL